MNCLDVCFVGGVNRGVVIVAIIGQYQLKYKKTRGPLIEVCKGVYRCVNVCRGVYRCVEVCKGV